MALYRKCKKCGARISMREMPQGQWVAFDIGSDEPHEHGVAGRKGSKTIIRRKNKSQVAKINQTLAENEIVDRQSQVHNLNNLPNHSLDLTPFNLRRFFDTAIDLNLAVQIKYLDREDNETTRIIHPKSFQNSDETISDKLRLVAFCRLRETARTFSLRQITEVKLGSEISTSESDYREVSRVKVIKDETPSYSPIDYRDEPKHPSADDDSDYSWFWIVIGLISIALII